MTPATLDLTAQAQHFLSNDGRLEVRIPAGAVSNAQLQAAGGKISLTVTQILPGSGGLRNEHVLFGTYELQLHDAFGAIISNLVLAHPLVLSYHLFANQQGFLVRGQTVYALWRSGDLAAALAGKALIPPKTSTLHLTPTPTSSSTASRHPPLATTHTSTPTVGASSTVTSTPVTSSFPTPFHTILFATGDRTGLVWSISTTLSSTATHSGVVQTPSTITFGTQAPQATWGTPQDFQTNLNSGDLTYTYPLTLPPGPGGFTPPLALTYSSGAVNENHNQQAAAPWVGEGWNLSLGSISWAQEDVTPNSTNKIESVWHINDPSGISGQLIPPDLTTSTIPPYNPAMSFLDNNPYLWHTAPESHTKVDEADFGGQPCWKVWLPNGIKEEYGCTNDSRQSYVDSNNNVVQWRWDLDLMIDAHGNQIHVTYQRIHPSSGYVQDAVLSSITYDDPTCHNTTTACTTWNPQVSIIFDASAYVSRLTGGNCSNWSTSNNLRCDDPIDISGGLPKPKVLNSYVLNDVKIEVGSGGNLNILHEYTFSYEQIHSTTITDPATGEQESVRGYLDLTQIQEQGTGGNSPPTQQGYPVVNISYTDGFSRYEDLYQYAQPLGSACPLFWMPTGANGCLLWSIGQHIRYLSLLDNGRGWHEAVTWREARNNTHGVDSGAIDNVFTCYLAEQHGNLCSESDDKNWSRFVVLSRTATSNGVSATWNYQYYLQRGLPTDFPGSFCASPGTCQQGYSWGNENDADYLDFYNGQFQSFLKAQVTLPDGSYQVHLFDTTPGWGLAESSITCYLPYPQTCSVAPYFTNQGSLPAAALAGKEVEEDDYGPSNGGTSNVLLAVHKWNYALLCPPPGVSNSLNNGGGPPNNPGNTQLISQLDQNNPVVVCDPRVTQEDRYQVDGLASISDPKVVHQTTTYSYDSDNVGGVSGYDYGNLNETSTTGNDIYSGYYLITHQQMYPNDNFNNGNGIYLTDLPAVSQVRDGGERPFSCTQAVYGANTNATSSPTVPDVTQSQSHTVGDFPGCADSSNLITVQHTYDSSGNALTAIDGDNHKGCNSNTASACATYDTGTYDTHLLTATNARNQTTAYTYDPTATGGFGQWLTAITDINTQTTTYQYDVMGRLTGIVRPGDSSSNPTVSYSYLNSCTNGSTTPCLELDTSMRFTVGGPLSTMKQWYDGWGHLVETQVPSPTSGSVIVTYSIYDTMGRSIVKSLPYAIPDPSGYIAPDQTQARSVTNYDGLGRSLGSVTYDGSGNIVLSTTLQYVAAIGVTGISVDSSNPFEQTIALDAYNHQSITYTDALGRVRYTQVFSGESSPYTMVRTVYQHTDYLGNIDIVQTYDSTGTIQASYTAVFDALSRRTGFNDSDLGGVQQYTFACRVQ